MELNRVLLAINVRWWNAEAAYAVNVARGLVQQGVKVWMIVNPDSPVHKKAAELQIPVTTSVALDSRSPRRQIANLHRILDLVDTHHIQLINSFKSNGAFLFGLVRRIRPGVVYIKTRGEARPPRRHFLNRWLYGRSGCDGVIAAGELVRKWVSALDLPGQSIQVIHYGDTPLKTDPNRGPEAVRRELGIPVDAFVVALLGRTQGVKGHMVLLEALRDLRRPGVHLLLLIKDPQEFPAEMADIEDFLHRYHLRQQTTLLGFRPDLGAVLSCADLGVIPSWSSEVNCRAAVEFFSLGIPVLAFPTGTLPDLIDHGVNGYLCPEKSRQALADGLQWMLADPGRLQSMGDRGRADYREKFTLEKMAEETRRFYDECRRQRGRNRW